MLIHHIGYLIDEIESAAKEFEALGFSRIGEIVADPSREINILFLDNNGHIIELIQPICETSPFYRLRKKYRNSPYHICFQIDDLQKQIVEMEHGRGYTLIQKPSPAPAIQGCPDVAFLIHRHIGIIELIAKKK